MSKAELTESSSLPDRMQSKFKDPMVTERTPFRAPLPVPAILNLLQSLIGPTITIKDISATLTGAVTVAYSISLSDNTNVVLKVPPAEQARLLRHEKHSLATELSLYRHLNSAKLTVSVPRVLASDLTTETLGTTPFILTTCVPGHALIQHYASFTAARRNAVARQLGELTGSLLSLRSPTFGPLWPTSPTPSWRLAFVAMLESALRDAEDVLLALPYETIRLCVAHHAPALDAVRDARIVLLDLAVDAQGLLCDDHGALVGLAASPNAIWGDPRLARVFEDAPPAFFEGLDQDMLLPQGRESVRTLL
ncbi:MAG: hypothetical protein M1825_003507 [Sarcosagium campestre]|nr:MAG: hypothetical protein M1825_003507 [Sarcosagium campestre]